MRDQREVFTVRGYKVMLDFGLAARYEIETRPLKQAVRRSMERFPQDFMFELTADERASLRSQIVTLEKSDSITPTSMCIGVRWENMHLKAVLLHRFHHLFRRQLFENNGT